MTERRSEEVQTLPSAALAADRLSLRRRWIFLLPARTGDPRAGYLLMAGSLIFSGLLQPGLKTKRKVALANSSEVPV